jgi:peroxiredoxin
MPRLELTSTRGRLVDLSAETGRAIVFVYPWTGTPGLPDPPNWDDIPGAHGSTPEALGFARLWPEFEASGVAIYGVSGQTPAEQLAFSQRNGLTFELLSDEGFAFADALGLERFATGGVNYLKRQTFVVQDAMIVAHIRDVPDPAGHAGEMLAAVGLT